jgi:hypothetical protein
MTPEADTPSDTAFEIFLAAFDVACFTDWEFRLYQTHRLHRV